MPKIFLGNKISSDPNFFLTQNFFWPKMNFNEHDLWRDKTDLLNLRLSRLPSAKVLLKLEFDTEDQVLLSFKSWCYHTYNLKKCMKLIKKKCFWPSLDDRKSQFCHAKKFCGSGNYLIYAFSNTETLRVFIPMLIPIHVWRF